MDVTHPLVNPYYLVTANCISLELNDPYYLQLHELLISRANIVITDMFVQVIFLQLIGFRDNFSVPSVLVPIHSVVYCFKE